MDEKKQKKRLLIFRFLTIVAAGLIGAAYFQPIWWVSLTAPNYPEEVYPVGVRVHFYATKIANGCPQLESDELYEDEPVDCVHEMNTINHFIGMEPMEAGGQIEMMIAPYGFTAVCVTLLICLFYAGVGWWLPYLVGFAMPIVFIVDYSAWLYWFGHNLHPWGAFTVKPFMPTVFGEGKVAQFSTYSYPHNGFLMMAAASVLLLFAFLFRRKYLKEARANEAA